MEPHKSIDLMVLRSLMFLFIIFVCFKFWDGIHSFIPNMWQVVYANISIQGRGAIFYIHMQVLTTKFPQTGYFLLGLVNLESYMSKYILQVNSVYAPVNLHIKPALKS